MKYLALDNKETVINQSNQITVLKVFILHFCLYYFWIDRHVILINKNIIN